MSSTFASNDFEDLKATFSVYSCRSSQDSVTEAFQGYRNGSETLSYTFLSTQHPECLLFYVPMRPRSESVDIPWMCLFRVVAFSEYKATSREKQFSPVLTILSRFFFEKEIHGEFKWKVCKKEKWNVSYFSWWIENRKARNSLVKYGEHVVPFQRSTGKSICEAFLSMTLPQKHSAEAFFCETYPSFKATQAIPVVLITGKR